MEFAGGRSVDRKKRKSGLLEELQSADRPISASALAGKFGVSRQIIVGDIAILRAEGHKITATPRGYILPKETGLPICQIACKHDASQIQEELNAIVDCGGSLVDVIVEHPLYGELVGNLQISNRMEAEDFVNRVRDSKAAPLSMLTDGIHLHTISCKNPESFDRIREKLRELGILLS